MIAGDPDPAPAADEPGQALAIGLAQALAGLAVMEAVAQADHGLRLMALDDGRQLRQGLGRVIGRQELAAGGEARALLQMQIGDGEQPPLRPDQRAGEIGQEIGAVEAQRGGLAHSGSCGAGLLAHRFLDQGLGRLVQQLVHRRAIDRFLADLQQHRHGQRRDLGETAQG